MATNLYNRLDCTLPVSTDNIIWASLLINMVILYALDILAYDVAGVCGGSSPHY